MRSGDLVGIVALLLVSSLQTAGSNGSTSSDTFCSSEKGSCDFSNYKPLKEPHSLVKSVVKRVDPKYPSVARSAKAEARLLSES